MSRLFTRLENIGQEGSDKGPLSLPEARGAADPPVTPARADAGNSATPLPAVDAAPLPPLVPGYVGAPALPATPLPPATRPTWTVRLWFASVVSLIALSLFVLLMPQQAASPRKRPATAEQEQPKAAAPAPEAAAAAIAPSLPATVTPAARPIARTDVAPAPAPAPVRPATPARVTPPASSAAPCTEAMLALNLCATPSP